MCIRDECLREVLRTALMFSLFFPLRGVMPLVFFHVLLPGIVFLLGHPPGPDLLIALIYVITSIALMLSTCDYRCDKTNEQR